MAAPSSLPLSPWAYVPGEVGRGIRCLRAPASHAVALLCCLSPVVVQKNGVETIHDVPALSDFEAEGLASMKGDLAAQIQKGVDFVASK